MEKHIGHRWVKIGEVGVDSGQLMICDPCNLEREWTRGTEPEGHETLVLTEKGKAAFPGLDFAHAFPFPWGDYASPCPKLGGLSMNEARENELVANQPKPITREFSYRGASSVTLADQGEEEDQGQLNYNLGHPGAGVAFPSGYGDGVYPVYARFNLERRVVEVRILMDLE